MAGECREWKGGRFRNGHKSAPIIAKRRVYAIVILSVPPDILMDFVEMACHIVQLFSTRVA